MIDLKNAIKIGEGNSRVCYVDPTDSSKIIKVEKKTNFDNYKPNNKIENIYMKFLMRKNKDLSHLPQYYGLVETTLGNGVVFDMIENCDQSKIFSLQEVIEHELLSDEIVRKLLFELIKYLRDNTILFVDISFDNILCKKTLEGYKLIIIDGLGSRKLKINFWLYMKFEFLAKRKVLKQTKQMIFNYEKMLVSKQQKRAI